MAKTSTNKLKLNKELIKEVTTVKLNEEEIQVKKYLPVNSKLQMVAEILNAIIAENNVTEDNIYNPVKVEVFTSLKIIEYYTNISLTKKQKEDAPNTYDLLESNKVFDIVVNCIPEEEYNFLITSINDIIEHYHQYKNSAMGIMEAITKDYENINLDATELIKEFKDPKALPELREIMEKLG